VGIWAKLSPRARKADVRALRLRQRFDFFNGHFWLHISTAIVIIRKKVASQLSASRVFLRLFAQKNALLVQNAADKTPA